MAYLNIQKAEFNRATENLIEIAWKYESLKVEYDFLTNTDKEVTFDYSTNHAVRVDYMRYKPVNNTVSGIEKGDFYCYEVKSSVEDFRSGHGLNFLGDYNYLVMPEKIYATISLEVPHYVGVYVLDGTELTCIKKAKRHDRSRPVSEMLLMMFRSAARDRRRICSEITQE